MRLGEQCTQVLQFLEVAEGGKSPYCLGHFKFQPVLMDHSISTVPYFYHLNILLFKKCIVNMVSVSDQACHQLRNVLSGLNFVIFHCVMTGISS